jgi:hypothetical protein
MLVIKVDNDDVGIAERLRQCYFVGEKDSYEVLISAETGRDASCIFPSAPAGLDATSSLAPPPPLLFLPPPIVPFPCTPRRSSPA